MEKRLLLQMFQHSGKGFQMDGEVLLPVVVGKEHRVPPAQDEDPPGEKDAGLPGDFIGVGPPLPDA